MQNYKDTSNKLHVLDDVSFEYLLPNGCIKVTQAEADAISSSPKPLNELQEDKRNEIRLAYEADNIHPVVSLGFTFDGGFDSAIKLDAAKRLSEAAGLSFVTFYDVDNAGHDLSIANALTVCIDVSSAYQTSLAKKQSLFAQITAANTAAKLELIKWA